MGPLAGTVTTDALQIARNDTVAVALRDLDGGEVVRVGGGDVELRDAVPGGHKFSLQEHSIGAAVIKYGDAIGRASCPIPVGAHVHEHNLETVLDGLGSYHFEGGYVAPDMPRADAVFDGYVRAHGRVGTRNEIWLIPTVGCVANVCVQLAAEAGRTHAGRVDGVHAFPHPFGCSQLGDDLAGTRAILAALAGHPNAGGVVLVGLGCESNQMRDLLAAADLDPARVRTVVCQGVEDELEAGLSAIGELVELASHDVRSARPISDLVIGVKCGGSDGYSGLTANPLTGDMTDRVAGAGGSVVMTEIPEMFGAEHTLMRKAASADVFDRLVETVNRFKQYFIDHDQPIYENPSPGNRQGGITSLEEKSLGAVQKAGQAQVTDVIGYGARVRRNGLTVIEGPGNDAVSSTAMIAAGATLLLFTTGRGTPLGFPAPTIKIASNSRLASNKARWVDFDAGVMLAGEPREVAADRLFDLIVRTASGVRTRSEVNEERSIAIWKRGVTL